MTYSVTIQSKPEINLPDIVDWLDDHDLHLGADWYVTKPDYFKNDWNYTFKFKRSEHATIFALRWV